MLTINIAQIQNLFRLVIYIYPILVNLLPYCHFLVSSFGDGEDEIAQEEIDLPLTRTNTDKDGDFLAFR